MHLYGFILFIIIFQILNASSVTACKDIIACGNATDGEYNLLLKVRDPSRSGYQVLCMIPQGYEYQYHHPWTGEALSFTASHSYIGVASKDDVPPSIVKAGMTLTDAGLAFGDADSMSRWVNPSQYSWDDFDWIRYACEQADAAEEAAYMLTTEVVDQLHAPGVSENLFVVGPDTGYLIEADAFRYHIKKIDNGFDVISNYPRELWKSQYLSKLPISPSFELEKEKMVSKGNIIRLQSIKGIRITDINETSISVKQIPFFTFVTYENGKPVLVTDPVHIDIGERKTVGDFSVTLVYIKDSKAQVHVETVQHAWQNHVEEIIEPEYGHITIRDMMNWSRLNESMLDGLRPMCEPTFIHEGSAIYNIPKEGYEILSSGWFAANHAHSSIFVPFHIYDTDIFDPYETGEVALLSSSLSQTYFDGLLPIIIRVEDVFLYENGRLETWAAKRYYDSVNLSNILTISDMSMQSQAWLMLQICDDIDTISEGTIKTNLLRNLEKSYDSNYSFTLDMVKEVFFEMRSIEGAEAIQDRLIQIVQNICESTIDMCHASEKDCLNAEQLLEEGNMLLLNGQYDLGFDRLKAAYTIASDLFYNLEVSIFHQGYFTVFNSGFCAFFCLIVSIISKKNKK